ncbi:hypothetical protein WJ60_06350 [Burkholderia ubonensis]|nr:hypothetical protein WJ60_06350 [Burkholderia ubonensis]
MPNRQVSEAPLLRREPRVGMAGNAMKTPAEQVPGTTVRYSFRSWEGKPAVDLQFTSTGAAQQAVQMVTARTAHDQVRNSLQQHAFALPSGIDVRFDGQSSDGQRGDQQQPRDEQESDEQ